jgi:two-component system response regulator RegX3
MSSARKPRVLVVEDEPSLRGALVDALAARGLEVTAVTDGDEGLRAARGDGVDLVVLDVMLPRRSGFDVCEALRAERPQLPILILTARAAEDDVLRGFRAGADDYVTKPFSLAQLGARLDALLRRARSNGEAGPREPFGFGDWRVDPEALVAESDAGRVELTRREADLLAVFARERGRIVGRRALLREVWGFEHAERIETRTVDVHLAKLRKKLGVARELIRTVRGEGYRFG